MNSREKVEQFKRDLLAEKLGMCEEKQVAFFHKIFPNGVSPEKIMNAIDLVDRTLAKNEKRKAT